MSVSCVGTARVSGPLLRDPAFPRAIACCLDEAKASCSKLPRSEQAVVALERVNQLIEPGAEDALTAADVSLLMDTLQKCLGRVHQSVVDTWFLPGDSQ